MSVAKLIPKQIRDQHDANMSPGSGTNGYAIVYNHGTGKFELGTFDTAGAAAAAVAAHVALSNPHSQYLLSSGVSAYGATLIDDADAATARATLGLGTAAVLNVGTGANEIVQLDGSSRLPAVDGSQLTNLPGVAVAGSTTQVIFNDAGAYAGDPGLTYAKATDRLTVAGGLVAPSMRPASDSTTSLQMQNAAGTAVVTVDTTTPALQLHYNAAIYSKLVVDSDGALTITRVGTAPNKSIFTIGGNTTDSIGRFYMGELANAYASLDASFAMTARATAAVPAMIVRSNVASNGNNGVILQAWQAVGGSQLGAMTNAGQLSIGSHIPTAALDLAASTTARASLRIRTGVAPTSPAPNVGDMYQDGTHVYMYLAGAWKQLDN